MFGSKTKEIEKLQALIRNLQYDLELSKIAQGSAEHNLEVEKNAHILTKDTLYSLNSTIDATIDAVDCENESLKRKLLQTKKDHTISEVPFDFDFDTSIEYKMIPPTIKNPAAFIFWRCDDCNDVVVPEEFIRHAQQDHQTMNFLVSTIYGEGV